MSSSNEMMSVEEPDALEQFQELYGSVMESVMETTEPPQVNEEDPYSYNPFDFTQLPQTEGEVKIAIKDLTQKLQTGGLTRRNLLNRSLKECPEKWKAASICPQHSFRPRPLTLSRTNLTDAYYYNATTPHRR
jgi:hypothetical protein